MPPKFLLAALSLIPIAATPAAPGDTLLAGRTAEAPRSCIPVYSASESTIRGDGTIVFRTRLSGRGPRYVNAPRGCNGLEPGRAISGIHPTGQLCSGDIISVSEPQTGFTFGSCALGDFTPYVKPRR